jgi:glycosyltransferase involved in cell wall biosynthesis
MSNHLKEQPDRLTLYWYTSPRTKGYFADAVEEYCDLILHTEVKPHFRERGKVRSLVKRAQFLGEHGIDAIIADSFGLPALLMALQAKRLGIPFIIRIRGGMWGEFRDETRVHPKWLRRLYASYQEGVRDRVLRLADSIFAVSVFGKSQLLYEIPELDSQKIHVLYKPVNLERFSHVPGGTLRQRLSLAPGSRILLTATNFNYYRKYQALLHYWDPILRLLDERRSWHFVILGGGHDLEQFRKVSHRRTPPHLDKRIHLTGFYPGIAEAMVDADVILYLSFRDMAPQVLKEAQATGKPVVVNRSCGGTIEFMPPYEHGPPMIIERTDELLETLRSLAENENLREQIGQENRSWAIEWYDVDRQARSFVEYVKSSIRAHRQTGSELPRSRDSIDKSGEVMQGPGE